MTRNILIAPCRICTRACSLASEFYLPSLKFVGRERIVVITTCYGLNGQGSNPDGGEIFRTLPDLPWSPYCLLYNGYRGQSGWDVALTIHPNLVPRLKKERNKENGAIPLFHPLCLHGLFEGELYHINKETSIQHVWPSTSTFQRPAHGALWW